MARRGRKPTGPQLVERLQGSEHAKNRLKVIVETLSGQRTIPDACAELGIHESMFHKMRSEVLQAGVERLEPRPLGRPSRPRSAEEQRIDQLQEQLHQLTVELRAADVRRELAEHLRLTPPAADHASMVPAGKKTTEPIPSRPTNHRRKKRRR
jgi:hypothetical protein